MSTLPFDKISKQAKVLREEITRVQAEFPGSGQLFFDLARALDLFDQRKNTLPQYFSDAKIRPSRESRRIKNAESNLQRQKDILGDIKRRKANSLKNPGRSEAIPVEAIEAAEERVRLAEMQLARAKGEYAKFTKAKQDALKVQAAKDLQESADGITSWQAGWRSGDWQNPTWGGKRS